MLLKIKLIFILFYLFHYDFKKLKYNEIQYYLNTFSFLEEKPINMNDTLILKRKNEYFRNVF